MKATISLISSSLLVMTLATSTLAQVGAAPVEKGTPTPQEIQAVKERQASAVIHHHVIGAHEKAAWEAHHRAAMEKKMQMEKMESGEHASPAPAN